MRTADVLLALDTSTQTVGFALYDGKQVWCESIWKSGNYHTVELAPAVSEAMERTRLTPAKLGALGVALGPGSFTGLRVGLAFAKGLAMAEQIPLIGIPSLDILAATQPVQNNTSLVAVLRAGRNRLAVGWYRPESEGWKNTGEFQVMTAKELANQIQKPVLVCGELTDAEREVLGRKWKNVCLASPANSIRRPSILAELAWKRWGAGDTDDPTQLAPIYLHYNEPIPV